MADTQSLAKRAETLQEMLVRYRDQIERALPKQINVERFNRMALTYAVRRPEVLNCELKSIVVAFMQAAQLGLECDDVRGHAHIVPFWDSKKKMFIATFIPGYKGLIDLALRSKQVSLIDCHIVYDKEPHEYKAGLMPVLDHTPMPPHLRGDPIATYAIAKMKDGGVKYVWLWKEEVEKIREKSAGWRAYKAGKTSTSIWLEYPEIMMLKTGIRYLAKFIPQSPELQKATGIEESIDSGQPIKEFFFDEDAVQHLEEAEQEKEQEQSDSLKEKTLAKQKALQEKLPGAENGQS